MAYSSENMWPGCWWCDQFGSIPLRGFTTHGCTSTTVNFCPMCGKPLTEEAKSKLTAHWMPMPVSPKEEKQI